MFIEVALTLLGLLLWWDYLSKRHKNAVLAYMPGPKAWPLIGNILMYRGQSPEDVIKLLANNTHVYGPIYRVWLFRKLVVFSTDPNDIECILGSPVHITKNSLYELLHEWLGTGLLMSTSKKWHSRRKIITPAFHFKILEQFVEIFDRQSNVLVQKLQEKADGKTEVNIFPYICLLALDVIAETAMGTKVNAQFNPDLPYVQAVTTATQIISKRFINVHQRSDWVFRITAPLEAQRLDRSIKIMHDFTEKIITERREALEQSIRNGTYRTLEEDIGLKQRMALLDVLLQSTIDGQPLSNEDIREEVDTFMFEGHDTTANAMSFCLSLISRHPEVQAKIVEEIRQALGDDKNRPISLGDLCELKYLECVIKESLRLHPPVPIIGRYFKEQITINGKTLPADSNYTVGVYITLRDPKYFPEPDTFKPERFMDNAIEEEKFHAYAYIPFSAGPRNCIGQRFAMLEMKSTISKILRHFELLPLGPEARPMLNLVLRSMNGNHLGLRPRDF